MALEKGKSKRMVLGLAADTTAELERIAAKRGVSKLEIVRRSLALFMLVERELEEAPRGSRLAITTKDSIFSKIAHT